ncbi:MAG: UDP-glucose/GDP-mannose dehydrogenase family protein [Armatimonadetes bacterium]|nr:UDP-glucose/GDP-mannose dehydrogenase family protein [Armatimonadota bacterium]
MKVAVVGTGYVGLVTGVVLAKLGADVTCVDNDKAKLKKLREGISPIYEPGIEDLMKQGVEEGRLRYSDSVAKATKESDIVFIAVGTPPMEDGTPDIRAVKAVAREIAKNVSHYTVIVNKSTVPVGTGELVTQILREEGLTDEMAEVVSNPEFLREGSACYDALNPDRIVIGANSRRAASKVVELYWPVQRPMFITDLASAELIKYASNSFLAMKISFINAISRLCELCGADVQDVAKGLGADARIGNQFLQAGLGWGGSCFPKDVSGLITVSEQFGYDFKLLKEVVNINEDQTINFMCRLENRLGGLKGRTIGLLGLAFKPNTDDIRDAKSLAIIEFAKARGAKIKACDRIAAENVKAIHPDIEIVDDPYAVAEDADAVILVTEWAEFRNLDLAKLAKPMKSKVLFDGRRLYGPARAERAGLEYHTIGSGNGARLFD